MRERGAKTMRFSENRRIAFVVLAVCVLVSVFGFGGAGLSGQRSKALKVYDRGAEASTSTRHSVDAYLDSAAANAALMASEAGLHLESSPIVDSVAQLAGTLAGETDLDARSAALVSLKTDADKLYDAMYRAWKDQPEFTDFKVAYDDFWQDVNMIKFDSYPKLAAKYNDLTKGFPGGVVSGLLGQGSLNTFEN